MNEYKVYKYIFPDGRAYVGVTKHSIQHRKDCGYQHNKPLSDAIKSTGWANIKKVIIADGLTRDDAFAMEKKIIKDDNLTNPSKGYNVSYGGSATFENLKHSEEFKKEISKRLKGRTYSDETLERMRKAHEKERVPVVCISGTSVVAKYESLHSAADAVRGYCSNISRACNSGRPYKGFLWKFLREGVV